MKNTNKKAGMLSPAVTNESHGMNSNMIGNTTINHDVCSDKVVSNNNNRMKTENKKNSAGVSHPAADTNNYGGDIISRMEYLNEKVSYEIDGFSGKFEVCRWMHEIVSKAATKAQFKSFSYLTRIAWNWNNFNGYFHRLMCAPEEAGMLRKDLRNIKALMKNVRFSFLPYREEFLSRMEPLVEEFTKMHDQYGKTCEIIHAMH